MNIAQTVCVAENGGSAFTITPINAACFMISIETRCESCLENRCYTQGCSHIKVQQSTKGPLWRNCRAALHGCTALGLGRADSMLLLIIG